MKRRTGSQAIRRSLSAAVRATVLVAVFLTARPPDRLTAWTSAGWAEASGDRVRLRPEGWLLLDALVRDLTGSPSVT